MYIGEFLEFICKNSLVFKGQNDKNDEKRNNIPSKNGIIKTSRKLERQHEFLQS